MRILLAIIPLPFALSLILLPDLGSFSLIPLLWVFVFGAVVGTFTHVYWLRTLLKERVFYKKFYKETVMKPLNNDPTLYRKHTRIVLPFYLMGILVFILVVFAFGIFEIDPVYLLPLMLGAMEGIPISYYLMERGHIS